jgi:hypothetical protein
MNNYDSTTVDESRASMIKNGDYFGFLLWWKISLSDNPDNWRARTVVEHYDLDPTKLPGARSPQDAFRIAVATVAQAQKNNGIIIKRIGKTNDPIRYGIVRMGIDDIDGEEFDPESGGFIRWDSESSAHLGITVVLKNDVPAEIRDDVQRAYGTAMTCITSRDLATCVRNHIKDAGGLMYRDGVYFIPAINDNATMVTNMERMLPAFNSRLTVFPVPSADQRAALNAALEAQEALARELARLKVRAELIFADSGKTRQSTVDKHVIELKQFSEQCDTYHELIGVEVSALKSELSTIEDVYNSTFTGSVTVNNLELQDDPTIHEHVIFEPVRYLGG